MVGSGLKVCAVYWIIFRHLFHHVPSDEYSIILLTAKESFIFPLVLPFSFSLLAGKLLFIVHQGIQSIMDNWCMASMRGCMVGRSLCYIISKHYNCSPNFLLHSPILHRSSILHQLLIITPQPNSYCSSTRSFE